ncbi:MAG: DUF2807 domain-containing protein [Bacteroidota bacterium]|nr:DUF2807 domain-containing protein [Bacteroidota bacterium]
MKVIFILFLGIIFSSHAYCGIKNDCAQGNGQVSKETRDIPAFHSIESNGSFEIYLTQGTATTFRIEAESNILPLITAEVHEGTLVLDTKKCIDSSKGVKIYLSAATLKNIILNGSGVIVTNSKFSLSTNLRLVINGSGNITFNIAVPRVESLINGAGNISLDGEATEQNISIIGSGSLMAYDIISKKVSLDIQGSGSIEVNATQRLEATISGSGSVSYHGSPEVIKYVTGSGEIVQR